MRFKVLVSFATTNLSQPRRGCGTKPKVGPLLAWRAYLGINARAHFNLKEVVAIDELRASLWAVRQNLFEVWEPGQPKPI